MNPTDKMVEQKPELQRAFAIFKHAEQCDGGNYLIHALQLYKKGIQMMEAIEPAPPRNAYNYYATLRFYTGRAERIGHAVDGAILSAELMKIMRLPCVSLGYSYDVLFGRYFEQPALTELVIEEPDLMCEEHFTNLGNFIACAHAHAPGLEFILVKTKPTQTKQMPLIRQLLMQCEHARLAMQLIYDNTQEVRRIFLNNGHIIVCDQGIHIYDRTPAGSFAAHTNGNYHYCKQATIRIYRCRRMVRALNWCGVN